MAKRKQQPQPISMIGATLTLARLTAGDALLIYDNPSTGTHTESLFSSFHEAALKYQKAQLVMMLAANVVGTEVRD